MTESSTIYLLRHAEDAPDPKSIHLSEQGHHRALGLIELFAPGGRFLTPQFLVAADKSKHSNRCFETLRPLADDLDLVIDRSFADDKYKALAQRIKSGKKGQGAVLLICWHHESLPNLAKALGAKVLPSKSWPDGDFDSVWVLHFDATGLRGIHSEPEGLTP